MKPFWLAVFVLSIALNGFLGWRLATLPRSDGSLVSDQQSESPAAKTEIGAPFDTLAAADPEADAVDKAVAWVGEQPEREELLAFLSRLENAGYPGYALRALAKAIVNQRYDESRAELLYPEDLPFWQHERHRMQPEIRRALSRIDLEQERALEPILNALPPDLSPAEYRRKMSAYGTAEPLKIRQMQSALLDRELLFTELRSRPGSIAEQLEVYEKRQPEIEAELFAVVSPDEFRDFQLRQSPLARQMLPHLDADTTLEEYTYLFDLQMELDDMRHQIGASLLGAVVLSYERLDVIRRQREFLGDERFAASLARIHPMMPLMAGRGLGPDLSATQYLDLQETIGLTRYEVHRWAEDPHVGDEERGLELMNLQSDALDELQRIAGPEWLEAFVQTPEGRFLEDTIAYGRSRAEMFRQLRPSP
ncbi:MAG: hypothetical protein EA425_17665 [Puniceicoccaceae bacterium]|nr:MAG: hypothetical protein EA425_17665 [Puniceicoccaceae bacterium]